MEFIVTLASDGLKLNPYKEPVVFNTLQELEDYAIDVGHELIINFKEKTIVVYDDYVE